jgi:hypothetical protein
MISPLIFAAALAAQPVPLPAPPPVTIRPGTAPEGTTPVPISETAEPLGLAIAGFDGDHDGRTSLAEFDAALARTFAAADRDRDGALGYIEYAGWAETWLGSATALPGPFAIDADGDNRLAQAEFTAEFRRHFTRLDKNADGSVSRAELLTLRNPRLAPVLDRDGRPIRQRERRRER